MKTAAKIFIAASLLAPLGAQLRADEVFPVNHSDPIRVRVVEGKSGRPMAYTHLVLAGGYDSDEVRRQSWREEKLTNGKGEIVLSRQMENLPWMQVWVEGSTLCQQRPKLASFSVERMRLDGLSTPNRCGTIVVEDEPGLFIVYVDNKQMRPKGGLMTVSYEPALKMQPAVTPLPVFIKAAPKPELKPQQVALEGTIPNLPADEDELAHRLPQWSIHDLLTSMKITEGPRPASHHRQPHRAAPVQCAAVPANNGKPTGNSAKNTAPASKKATEKVAAKAEKRVAAKKTSAPVAGKSSTPAKASAPAKPAPSKSNAPVIPAKTGATEKKS